MYQMRQDENGNAAPATLGGYRTLCALFGGPQSPAVKLLDKMIAEAPEGAESLVAAPDSQMRALLFPLMLG